MAPVVQRSSPKASPTKIRKGSKPPPWSLSDQVVATPSKHAVAAHKQRGRQQAGICKILDRDGDRRDDRRFQTCDALVFASAVRTSCNYYNIAVDVVANDMASRGFNMPGPSPKALALQPPEDAADLDAWLADSIYVVGSGRTTLSTTTKPIALSNRAVDTGWRAEPSARVFAWRQLQMWAALWRDSRVRVELVPGAGLGLIASSSSMKAGDEICRGIWDYKRTDYRCKTLVSLRGKVGSLLGPAALANAMCETHACAALRVRDVNELVLVAKRDIRSGQRICFTYEQVGEDPQSDEVLVCGVRGCNALCKV